MPRIDRSIFIKAAPERVFKFLTDPRIGPVYIPHVLKVTKASRGPVGVGTRYHCIADIAALRFEFDFSVCVYDPPHYYATEGSAFGAAARTDWRFTPRGDGTRVRVKMEGDVGAIPFINLLGGPLIQRIMERDIDQALKKVKTKLEGASRRRAL